MQFWYPHTPTVAVLLLVVAAAPVDGGQLQHWRQVLVSHTRPLGSSLTSQALALPLGANSVLHCPNNCIGIDWCLLWCHQPDNTCIISNILVTPAYTETNIGNTLPCYTLQPLDLATHANITAGVVNPDYPTRVPELLIDGLYNYQMKNCFASDSDLQHAWFVLDFGAPVTFSHVLLVAQPNNNAGYLFYDLEVRVGNTAVSAPQGLSSYDVFGLFPGGATKSQHVLMQVARPVTARFLSVQKMSGATTPNGVKYSLNVCHVEVY